MVDVTGNAINIFSLSLIFALISLSVYLTTAVMKVIDITCDSCVTLGGCVYAALVVSGIEPIFAFIAAVIFGVVAGFVVASITSHMKVNLIISSIITIAMIQTFVVKLCSFESSVRSSMQKAGIGLTHSLSACENAILVVLVTGVIYFLFSKFLNSEYGLALRAFRDGVIISESLGIDSKHSLWFGLGLANGIAATAGVLMAQVEGDCSVSMGSGSLVFGMAAVMIGQRLMDVKSVKQSVISCFVGAFVYKVMLELFTYVGVTNIEREYDSVIIAIVLIFLIVTKHDQDKRSNMENF